MLKECYSPIERSLRTPTHPERREPSRSWFSLTLILLALTLSSNLGALPGPVGNPPKARTTAGYSIDFGLVGIKPSTTPVAVQELKREANNGDALAQNNLAYPIPLDQKCPRTIERLRADMQALRP